MGNERTEHTRERKLDWNLEVGDETLLQFHSTVSSLDDILQFQTAILGECGGVLEAKSGTRSELRLKAGSCSLALQPRLTLITVTHELHSRDSAAHSWARDASWAG